MEYHYKENNSFEARLNAADSVSCENVTCENNTIYNLTECSHASFTISHESCVGPKKILTLEVPPGKYKLVSICIFTKLYNSTCEL